MTAPGIPARAENSFFIAENGTVTEKSQFSLGAGGVWVGGRTLTMLLVPTDTRFAAMIPVPGSAASTSFRLAVVGVVTVTVNDAWSGCTFSVRVAVTVTELPVCP